MSITLSTGLLATLLQGVSYVEQLWNITNSNDDFITQIKKDAPILAQGLELIGTTMFPGVAPEIAIIGAVVAAFSPNYVRSIQGLLNVVLPTIGWAQDLLVVDGLYGPKTTAAVHFVEQHFGLDPDGIAGNVVNTLLNAVLSSLSHK